MTRSSTSTRVDLSPRARVFSELDRPIGRRVSTRAELLAKIWGSAFDGEPNIVDVYVGYLRGKLRPLDASVRIETVRGLGYRLVVSP
jgi:two-component system OmpR family response regulator